MHIFPRRALRAVLAAGAALALAAMLLPVGPIAQAATFAETFTSTPFEIQRNGKTFKVQVTVLPIDDTASTLDITISEVKDPSGVARARASETWFRRITGFEADSRLSDGKLRPLNDQMQGFGKIEMDWSASEEMVLGCEGHTKTRKGRFAGTFKFQTGTDKFGTIQKSKLQGKLRSSDGECPVGGGSGSDDCPDESFSIAHTQEGGKATFFVEEDEGSNKATFGASAFDELENSWVLIHLLSGSLPSANADADESVTNGAVEGAAGTFTSGQSSYVATDEPYEELRGPCGGDREVVRRSTHGTWSGDFTLSFLLGSEVVVTGEGSAARWVVRASTP